MDNLNRPTLPIPAVGDSEGQQVPAGLPPIIDSHVHIFPGPIFNALWGWFEQFAWPIRYKGKTASLLEFLFSRGVAHVVALQYAHKSGMARGLNQYMIKTCQQFHGRVSGMATVFPGEKDAGKILEDAFAGGLKGVKLHIHVQCFDMNGPEMEPIYEACVQNNKPLVIHAGREPKSEQYLCDPYALCRADKLEAVLKAYPKLRICVPHLGMDEIESYLRLIEKYDTLWLDTSVACAKFFPSIPDIPWASMRLDRIMYGSDYPNIPYAWDREINQLVAAKLSAENQSKLFNENAMRFFAVTETEIHEGTPVSKNGAAYRKGQVVDR